MNALEELYVKITNYKIWKKMVLLTLADTKYILHEGRLRRFLF